MNIKSIHQYNGFTLVELMITITVLSIILFMGVSITQSWIDRSQVNNAINILKNSITQAKTAAIRNTNNQAMGQPAVSLCVQNNQLLIIRNKNNDATNCSLTNANNTLLKKSELAKDILIKQNNAAFNCIAFNSVGMVTQVTGTTCSTNSNLSFVVEKNNETANITVL